MDTFTTDALHWRFIRCFASAVYYRCFAWAVFYRCFALAVTTIRLHSEYRDFDKEKRREKGELLLVGWHNDRQLFTEGDVRHGEGTRLKV